MAPVTPASPRPGKSNPKPRKATPAAEHLTALVPSVDAAPDLESEGVSAEITQHFDHLLATVRKNRPHDDLDLIRRAWEFCVHQHAGQTRASGEPYIIHPLAVCQILADWKMDSTAIAAGLLHDAVEDLSLIHI